MIIKDDIYISVRFAPCDICQLADSCQHECSYFKQYVLTSSPANREKQQILFKVKQGLANS